MVLFPDSPAPAEISTESESEKKKKKSGLKNKHEIDLKDTVNPGLDH